MQALLSVTTVFTTTEAGASISLSGQADQATNRVQFSAVDFVFFTIGKDPGSQWRQASIGTLLLLEHRLAVAVASLDVYGQSRKLSSETPLFCK